MREEQLRPVLPFPFSLNESIRTFLLLNSNFLINTFSRITFSIIVFLPCAVFEVQFSGPSLLFLSEAGDAGTEMPAEHQVTAHPEIILTPCISSTCAQKRSLRAEIILLIPVQGVHLPKGGTSCDCGIYPSCSHPPQTGNCIGCSHQESTFSSGFFYCSLLICSFGFH